MTDQAPMHHVLGGADKLGASPMLGIIGTSVDGSRIIAVDHDRPHTYLVCGKMNSGKSYGMAAVMESLVANLKNLNNTTKPHGVAVFHYSESMTYAPEYTTLAQPNTKPAELALLTAYQASPQGIPDVTILAPPSRVAAVRAENPGITVKPLTMRSSEINSTCWRYLMGAAGDTESFYLKVLNQIIRRNRENCTLETLNAAVRASLLSDQDKNMALARLQLASEFIDDNGEEMRKQMRPGRVVTVDLRDDTITKEEILNVMVVLLTIFSDSVDEDGKAFPLTFVLDEFHKVGRNEAIVDLLVLAIREMRHKGCGMSIMIGTQEPMDIKKSMISLADTLVMYRFIDPDWLSYLQARNPCIANIKPIDQAALQPGEAHLWMEKCSEPTYRTKAIKVRMRPRVSLHGGGTKSATAGGRV